ncbi:MAG: hypothetical protein ABSH22_07155 [Tepidisphaeraceae bacterium]|jgi:type II secretory pathway pseudopilin PulG
MRRRGFTILDLVIVIVVLLFLAALLLPALHGGPHKQSVLVSCASNLKQIGLATSYYAEDNNGYLPQWPEEGLSPLRHGLKVFSGGSYWDPNSFPNYAPPVNLSAQGDANDPTAGIFVLHMQGYLGKWNYRGLPPTVANVARARADLNYFQIRFCPALSGQNVGNVETDWGSSYLYNPHWIYVDPKWWQGVVDQYPAAKNLGVGDQPITAWYRKVADYPPYAALGTDMIYRSEFLGHRPSQGAAIWNMLFADGHVQQVQDSYVVGGLDGKGDVAHGGNQGEVTDTFAGMKVLDDYLDILETEASGGNPLKTDAYSDALAHPQYPLLDREDAAKAGQSAQRY